jgi:hypothetical protein
MAIVWQIEYNRIKEWLVTGIKKNQKPNRISGRRVGKVIDCDEIEICVYGPPREHGKAHCHVISKKPVRQGKREVYPELKIFLDGTEVYEVTKGFTTKDGEIIMKIIFNNPKENEISNDEYLTQIWEKLNGKR